MRGYRFLKESNRLSLISEVKEALTNTHLSDVNAHASTVIFGAALNNAELVIRQYLLLHIAGLNLNKSLLYALGKPGSAVIHPLPPEWRKIIKRHGFKVANIRSALAWNGFVMMMLAFGISSIAKQVLKNIKVVLHSSFRPLGRYVYFESLTAGNLPQPCKDGRSHDIVTWYQQWSGNAHSLDTLCHGVIGSASCTVEGIPVIAIRSAIPPLIRPRIIISFVGWGITASTLALVDIFRGRWWHALLHIEAVRSAQVRLQDPEMMARDYLFHNSGWIYRPLWTYEAERKGSRILFYFYSTNCESFKRSKGYPIQANSWQAMNWPHYIVWDAYQTDFIRRAVGDGVNISVVGPIWFNTSTNEMPTLPPNSIAVFDVQPVRDAFYQTLGIDFDYYIPSTCNQFLIDIYNSLRNHNANLILKRKREIGKLAHYKYRNFLVNLKKQNNFIEVDNNIEAQRVIENCVAVISMPFTSTALLGRELGKPSVYYDPHGIVQKDDRAAHGIAILSGTQELTEWLNSIMRKEL